MEIATGHAWEVHYNTILGTPNHLAGSTDPLMGNGVTATQATLTFLAAHQDVFGMADPKSEFTAIRDEGDDYGWAHAHFQQRIRGIEVEGADLAAHYDATGALRTISSRYVPGLASLDLNPTLSAADALATAVRGWQASFQPTFQEKDFGRTPETTLVVYVDDAGRASLAYRVVGHIQMTDNHDPAKMIYFVDAKSGAALYTRDGLETTAAKGSGTDTAGIVRSMDIDVSGTTYTLVDSTRASKKISTRNLSGSMGSGVSAGTICGGTSATAGWDTACVGAHYYAETVYDYYKAMHARDSIDGAGMNIVSLVHYGSKYNNAFWDGNDMSYGDGDGTQFYNFTRGLDVIAHEMTHGVTSRTWNPSSSNTQGGAMNECTSDIFGALSEHWAQPDAVKNWQLGEDIMEPGQKPIRIFDHPHTATASQLDNYSQNTASTEVHAGATIGDNAFYLMTHGGTNDTSKLGPVTGIGWDKADKLMYLVETKYLTSSSNWAAFGKAATDAATELALTANEKNIVQCAWIATGCITSPTTCGDTTGGDGADGGTTRGDSGTTPPPPTDGGTTTDTTPPTIDAARDAGVVDVTVVPDAPTTVDVVTRDITTVDAPTVDAGRAGSGGTGGTGGAAGSGGSTGGSGGSTGGSGGSTGGTAGTGGMAGAGGAGGATGGAGGSGNRGGSIGTGGAGGSDPGCGCTVPGQSAPVSKGTMALALGLVGAIISRRRRRQA
jgi:thermolysin